MDRVFIDTNVLVDWLTQRPPFAEHSTKIVELIERTRTGDFRQSLHSADHVSTILVSQLKGSLELERQPAHESNCLITRFAMKVSALPR